MKIYIHTGLSRCGSSFMHGVFFSFLQNQKKIKIYELDEKDLILPFLNKKVETNETEIKELIKNNLNLKNDSREKVVITNESIAWLNWRCEDHKKDFLERTLLLKKIIPDAKIIFIIRHQMQALISEYKSSLTQRYVQDFNSFLLSSGEIEKVKEKDFRKGYDPYNRSKVMPWMNPIGYDYAYFIENYYNIFGKNNCLILFAENLRNPTRMEEEYYKLIKFFESDQAEAQRLTKNFISFNKNNKTPALLVNKSFSIEILYFIFLLEKFMKFFKIKISYMYTKKPFKTNIFFIKPLNKIFQILFFPKYVGWLKIREILVNEEHFFTKIIKFIFKKHKTFFEKDLIKTKSKFDNLDTYFDGVNYKLSNLINEKEIPTNFLKKTNKL